MTVRLFTRQTEASSVGTESHQGNSEKEECPRFRDDLSQVPANRVKSADVVGRYCQKLTSSRRRVHHAKAQVVLPVACLTPVAEIHAGREQGPNRRSAVERKILGSVVCRPVDDVAQVAQGRIAEQVQARHVGELMVGKRPVDRWGVNVENVDTADEAERVPDFMRCNTNEIECAGADSVGRVKIKSEGPGVEANTGVTDGCAGANDCTGRREAKCLASALVMRIVLLLASPSLST